MEKEDVYRRAVNKFEGALTDSIIKPENVLTDEEKIALLNGVMSGKYKDLPPEERQALIEAIITDRYLNPEEIDQVIEEPDRFGPRK
ncbi:MAG: hypothetical protein PHD02_00295 [Bacilli bacterium]|nr:hypothetical protein [Bacilli bacterium]